MPTVVQAYSIYRNRWCAAYWQQNGLVVIPTITWSDEKILDSIKQTLTNPDRINNPVFPNDRYQLEKTIEGVTVRASYYHQDGVAVFHSAYPLQ